MILRKPMATLNDIYSYIIGNLRYKLYLSKGFWYPMLVRKHIREQIAYRIRVMNPQCYSNGTCIECGCETPALQMAGKACNGNCYPPLVGSQTWNLRDVIRDGNKIWMWNRREDKYIYFPQKSEANV